MKTAMEVEKGTVQIQVITDDGLATRTVDAFLCGGLAAHEEWKGPDSVRNRKGARPIWIVTHVTSGKVAAKFPGKMKAKRALPELAGFIDWTMDEAGVLEAVKDPYDYGRLRQLVRDCGGF